MPPSKDTPTQQPPPPTLVAPKATCVMANVSKRPALKKQQQKPSSIAQRLRALNENESEDDRPLVFRKRKVAPPSDETFVPQVKKVKQTQHAPPPLTQPCTSKWEKRGARRPKRLKGEQLSIQDHVANSTPPVDIQLVH